MGITIKELSEISGYSCSTISRVITNKGNVKEDTRKAIEELLTEYNYRTNIMELRSSKLSRRTIMIIVGDLDNWYYMEIIRAINYELAKDNYITLIGYSGNKIKDEDDYVKMAVNENYAGIIFINVRGENDLCNLLEQSHKPVVFLNRGIRFADFNTIRSDNYQGAYMITDYLIGMGHKKIGHLAGSTYSTTACERKRGYADAMRDRNLVVTNNSIYIGNLDWESGYRYADYIVKKGLDYTAVFCGNDLMADGLMEALEVYGIKVPEDLSVVCYDDTPISKRRKLTTVGADPVKMGKKAAAMLLFNIKNEMSEENSVVFRPKITIRDSVGKII